LTSAGQDGGSLRRPAWILAAMVVVQIGLGCASWVLRYSWPVWVRERFDFAAGMTATVGDPVSAVVLCSHVALGSLILVSALRITLISLPLAAHWAAGDRSIDAGEPGCRPGRATGSVMMGAAR
jgi:hypothetical protein